MQTNLVGRASIFVTSKGTVLKGEIVAFFTHGTYHEPYVLVMYSTGELLKHHAEMITVDVTQG